MPLVALFLFLLVLVAGAAPGLASECLEFRLGSYFTPDMVLQSREGGRSGAGQRRRHPL